MWNAGYGEFGSVGHVAFGFSPLQRVVFSITFFKRGISLTLLRIYHLLMREGFRISQVRVNAALSVIAPSELAPKDSRCSDREQSSQTK